MSTRLRPLSGEAAKLWKLLTQHDLSSLRHGLELASVSGQPLDGLLEGVNVDARGELIRSSRFSGTATQQPMLDLVLLHQLSLASSDSEAARVRQSLRHLAIAVPFVPHLKGFDGLEYLDLTFSVDGHDFPSLQEFGLLPSLKVLTLRPGGKNVTLRSLEGLHAPQLEEARLAQLGLQDVSALASCVSLRVVDLSSNPELGSLRGLDSSTQSLQELRLKGCTSLADIEALRGAAELRSLDLEGCEALKSLDALKASGQLTKIALKNCASLISLQGLVGSELQPHGSDASIGRFSLRNCKSITSLRGLPRLSDQFRILELENMPGLKSLEGIEAASCVTQMTLGDASLVDLNSVQELTRLQTVEMYRLTSLVDLEALSQLPDLNSVQVRYCSSLTALACAWSAPLSRLAIDACPSLLSLGSLPTTLQEMELYATPAITTLHGLEGARHLKVLRCGDFLTDVAAVTSHLHLQVVCNPSYPRAQVDNIINAYGGVPQLRLEITAISEPDLRWLTQLPGLCRVWLDEACAKANGLEQQEYGSLADVQKLQRKICRAHKLPLPPHLKPARSSTKADTAGLSLKELKAFLTAADPVQVSEGLSHLKESGDPTLYDQAVDGMDPAAAYSGDSRAMGRLFKDVKADGRLLARWALTSVLADAPDAATQAVAARQRISALSLVQGRDAPNSWTAVQSPRQPALQGLVMPQLSGFTGLEDLSLQGLAVTDLAWIGDVPSLRHLTLKDLPHLVSLRGLAGVAQIVSIAIEDCPQVQDCSDLRHLGQLKGEGWRKLNLRHLGSLRDLGFVSGMSSLGAIELRVAEGADLSGFSNAASIGEVNLELDSWNVDLKHLRHVRKLHVRQEGSGEASSEHDWSYDWPSMEELYIGNGQHRFAGLQAPALKRVTLYGSASSLRGLGAFSRLEGSLSGVGSIDALVESRVADLDLSRFKGSFEPVSRIQSLRRLALPSTLSQEQIQALAPCTQIVNLTAQRFNGSLSFLKGWDALVTLDLRDSGQLFDLEVLLDLPALNQIRLKGAQMKRESWPAELQDRMSYRD